MRHPIVVSAALLLTVVACGGSAPAPASAPEPASASASEPAPAPAPESAPAPSRPLDLTSVCPHEVHLYFGAHPGDGHGEAAVVATGATIPVPRQADGTNVIWVVDDKGFGLASVNITKHMRHIRIDAACMKIDADSTR